MAAIVIMATLLPGAAVGADPHGIWLTEERDAAFEILPCTGDAWLQLCGRVVWLKEPNDKNGEPERDDRNPNPLLREKLICGLFVLSGLTLAAPDIWDGGSVYNPQDGSSYNADLRLLDDSRARVRAYIGVPFFGKTQIWTRADSIGSGLIKYSCRPLSLPLVAGSDAPPQ